MLWKGTGAVKGTTFGRGDSNCISGSQGSQAVPAALLLEVPCVMGMNSFMMLEGQSYTEI
jgi:hypothetical protein